MTLGLGVVGLGTAGAAMLGAAFAHPGVTVAAVADLDLAWLGSAPDRPPRRYDSLERLLRDDGVEAVHIATPTPLHYEHVRQALDAGRHVIVEKPVTAGLREAQDLVTRAAALDRVVIVGHSEAFEPYVQAVREVIAFGTIGAPVMVLAEKFTDWMRRPRLPEEWDGAAGGGIIRRQGVHQVDVVRTVAGTRFSVREAAVRIDQERGVPGGYTAWLASERGPSAVVSHDGIGRLSPAAVHQSRPAAADEADKRSRRQALLRQVLDQRSAPRLGAADRERLLVLGSDGEINATARRVSVTTAAGTAEVGLAGFAEGRHAVLDELISTLGGTASPVHTLAWGLESLRTCEDIERAAFAARGRQTALTGNCSALTHSRPRLATSFSKGIVSPTA
ncbi:MAG TPA: Gfo/Idh/MocA family oxidoreductase [Trebonia sp.]